MKSLEYIFKKTASIPDESLKERIWSYIERYEERVFARRRFAYLFLSFAALAGLVPAVGNLSRQVSNSGFREYFSLLFSGTAVLSAWKELLLSIGGSIPVLSFAVSLALVLILFFGVRKAVLMKKNPLRYGGALA